MKKVLKVVLAAAAVAAMAVPAVAADKLIVKDNATTPNTVFKVDDAGTITSTSSIFSFDSTNKRLGVGIAAPTGNLDVVGTSFPTARVMRQVTAVNTYSAMGISLQKTNSDPSNGFGPGFIFQSVNPAGVVNNAGVVYGVTETFDAVNATAGSKGGIRFGVFNNAATPVYAFNILSTGFVGVGTTTPETVFDINGNSVRVRTSRTPATASAACSQGEISWDSGYVYVCVAANSWKRAALATWP
jgi:hypothetical protein